MILVVAWDGACFDVVRPLLDAGELPVLASLLEQGASRELASTVPAVTFPAWSSFLTAAGPDHHGTTAVGDVLLRGRQGDWRIAGGYTYRDP